MDDRREPSGQRFVILRHEMPNSGSRQSHWDLMLENRGSLLTWELPTLAFQPLPADFERLNIRRLADHRLAYLSYEGPVSNDRGFVKRIDEGEFAIVAVESASRVRVRAAGGVFRFELQLPKAIFCDLDLGSMAAPAELDALSDDLRNAGELLSFEAVSATK